MKNKIIIISVLILANCISCQMGEKKSQFNFDFEQVSNNFPVGWEKGIGDGAACYKNNYDVYLDSAIRKNGKYSAVIEYKEGAPSFQSLAFELPNNYEGEQIILTGYIKTEDVTDGHAGLWMRIDPQVAFDNMKERGIVGTTDWTKYEVSLQMNPNETRQIVIGALLAGKGKMWIDNLTVTIDGEDITNAKIIKKPTNRTSFRRNKKATPLITFEGYLHSFVKISVVS